jgi:hypothetical protein
MNIFVVTSNYFDNGFFGIYSTTKRARIAFENFLATDEDIITFKNVDGLFYQFTTKNGSTFSAEIFWDYLDAEFEEGIVKED